MEKNVELRQAHLRLRRGHLYKYKSLKGDNFAHVQEIVRDSMIYCPTPVELNDPAECKPSLMIADIADRAYRPKVEAWVRRCISHRDELPSEEEIREEIDRLTQEALETMVQEATAQYQIEVNRQYRIVSFTDSPKNGHLWEVYGDDYAGVCLEFFVDPMLGSCFEVMYSDSVRALDM